MKQRAKRLLSMVLCAALLISLLPTMLSATTHATDTGAFGISTPSEMTEEEKEAAANNPFGVKQGSAFPLFVKSELFIAYGWDGNKDSGKNYIKAFDLTDNNGSEAGFNVNTGTTVGYSDTVGEKDKAYIASAVDGFNPGSGKDEYVAMLGLNASDRRLELSITNKNGQAVSVKGGSSTTYVTGKRSGDALKWLTDKTELHQMNGFLSVVCGDFDGDGMDSIIMYQVGAGNSSAQTPYLEEFIVTTQGTSGNLLVIPSTGVRVMNNLYDVLGGDVSSLSSVEAKNAPKVQMEAADTDKDGYDELVVTVSMNDVVKDQDSMKYLGTQVLIYDKLSSGWKLTARFSAKGGNDGADPAVTEGGDYADDRYRMVWGTSSVGNVIAEDDSGVITDFPEIVTVGLQDNESEKMYNINVDGDDKLVYSIVHCTGMTESDKGMKNYQGKYEAVQAGTLAANAFTKAGFYEDEDVSPLLQTKCYSYKGMAEADAVFISGSNYAWKGNAGTETLTHLYTQRMFTVSAKMADGNEVSNMQVESVAAGNFDGNDEGREQVAAAFLLKQDKHTNGYCALKTVGYYGAADGDDTDADNWFNGEGDGYYVTKKGKPYVALTDFDCDSDSVIVKYQDVEKQWSSPEVMAILVASPYFHDIGLDNNSCTDYGTDRSVTQEQEKSHSLTTNFVLGYEHETLNSGGGIEATIENNLTWSSNNSRTITYFTDFSNNTEETQVVVYRSPTLVYHFTNINNGEDVYISKALSIVSSMISVEEYNEQAVSYGLDEIDESQFGTPGIPNSYPSNTSQIRNAIDGNVLVGDNWSTYHTNGVVSKGVSMGQASGSSFNYEFDFSFTAYGLIFGVKIGGGAGYGYEKTTTVIKGQEISRSGTVDGSGVPDGYDFYWNFATWSIELNELTIPVCGYLVKNVSAPPSPAENLNITDITDNSLTLQWEAGIRPAEKYNIYRVLEESTDPYLYIGSVSGTSDGDGFTYPLSGLDSGTSYTFVVRGASGDKESVDGLSVTACTALPGGNSITINPLQSTYSVAPGDSVTLKTNIASSPNIATLTMVWQTRAAGTGTWRDINGKTDTSLTLSNVTQNMDGNQYRLCVRATTSSANVGYFYSNTATLSVSTTDTAATLSITGAGGGNGTLSPSYDPYTGNATTVVRTPITVTENRKVPATFQLNSTEGLVYQVVTRTVGASGPESTPLDPPVYIGKIVQTDTNGETTTYYLLTENDGTYSATGSALAVEEKYIDESGSIVDMPTTGGDEVTITVSEGENTVTYNAVALWNDAAATGTDEYKRVWQQEQDGNYYTYTEETSTFTQISLDDSQWADYEVLGNISYSSADQVVAGDTETYLLSGLGGAEGDVPTKTLVTSADYITVGEGENAKAYAVSNLEPVTITQSVEVITGYDSETMSGTALTLSATLRKANSSQVLSGTGADFVITNQTTGISEIIHKTSNSNGTISTNWTASSAGLYAIQVSIPGTTTLSSSLTAPQYYYASSQGSETQYRLRLKANGSDVAGSVSYGNTVSLVPESKTGTADWTDLTMGEGSGLSLTATLQGSTPDAVTNNSYFPAKAGKYTFTLVKTEGTTTTTLATATLNVTPLKLTVTPVWEGVIPGSLNDVTLEYTVASGTLSDADKTKLESALIKSSTYNFTNPQPGIYYVNLSWSTDAGKQSDIAALNSAYSITLSSASFYKMANSAPVYYEVVGGNGSIYATGANYMQFYSGEQQSQGTPLRFQATPATGYLVKNWKVNGNVVSADSTDYVVTPISGGNAQMLTIDSFDTRSDVSNNMLLVEVEFTNQVSTVTYSSGGLGSLTAKTSQGTAVQSGASLAYGASVVFTAEPDEGQMVKEWKVTVNGETPETYTWPDSGEIYRENTLILSDLAEESYTVYVEFTQEQTFTVASPVFVDSSGNPVNAGTITMTDANGEEVSAGDELAQGKAVTYTVKFSDSNYNTVNAWEYSTDGTNWNSDSDGGQLTYSCCKGSTGTLYVRAVVSVTQTYALSWKVAGLDEGDQATLSASSGGSELTNGGSYAVNTPVSFQLEVDGKYYVTAWTNAEQSASDPTSAALTLTKDTEVTVTVAKKPTVSWTNSTGGTITVQGLVNGTAQDITSGSYVDYNSSLTVTMTPDKGFQVSSPDASWTAVPDSDIYTYSISVQTDQTIQPAFAAIPAAEVTYSVVDINGSEDGGTNGTLTLSVTRKGMSDYAVTNDNDGTETVYRDSVVTFTATPDSGYKVSKWFVNGTEQSNQPELTITSADAQNVQVQFDPVGEAVTYGLDPAGVTDQASLSAVYQANGSTEQDTFPSGNKPTTNGIITFTVSNLTDGYEIEGWYVNGVKQDGQTDLTFAYSVTANVGADVQVRIVRSSYTVTFSGENGTVSAAVAGIPISSGDSVVGDTEVTFTAAPVSATGYSFNGWTVDGETSEETTEALTLTITQDTVVEAVYTMDEVRYTVAYGVIGENGTLSAPALDAENTAAAGSDVVFTATPADGYRVKGWYSDAAGTTEIPGTTAEQNSYTLENLLADASVYVAFEPIPTYDITVTVTGLGTVTATVNGVDQEITNNKLTVTRYDDVVLTAIPNTYHYLTGWTLDGTDCGNDSMTLNLTDVTEAHTVTANFASSQLVSFQTVVENAEGGTLTAKAGYGEDLSTINAATGISMEKGKNVVVTAVPNTGYMVKAWTVNGVVQDNVSNTLTIEGLSEATIVKVEFETLKLWSITGTLSGCTLTINDKTPDDYGTVEPTQIRDRGNVTFTVSPDDGTRLVELTVNGTNCLTDIENTGTTDKVTALVNSDNSVTITVANVTHDISLKAASGFEVVIDNKNANGKVTASSTYVREGDTVTLTVEPDKGYSLKTLTAAGENSGSITVDDLGSGKYSFTMPAERVTVTVEWLANQYTITMGSARNGSVTADRETAAVGDTVTLTVAPDKGYTLETLTVTDEDSGDISVENLGGGKYSFIMPASEVTVNATFMEDNSMLNFFVDVPIDAYYYDAVLWAAEEGITFGTTDTTFSPDDPCTRAQAVTFLWRAAGCPTPENTQVRFQDVTKGSYYETAVLWAVENGITNGTGYTTFSPDDTCTRAQFATFLWRFQGMPDSSASNPFTDVLEDTYFTDAVLWAVENGITEGTSDTTFSPNDPCTRAHTVTFLYRCMCK